MLFLGYDVTDTQVPENVTIKTDPWKHIVLLETDVEKEVLDAVFHICIELFIEGRENRHVGTSFSIGDADTVMDIPGNAGLMPLKNRMPPSDASGMLQIKRQ